MDKYAHRLHDWFESSDFGFQVLLAAHIGALTRDPVGPRSSGAVQRWWAQPVDPSRLILPGPFHRPQQWAARYYFYRWRVKREAKRVDLVHVLDHSYAHMIETAGRRPVVVTVHDLMPVVVLRSPTGGGGWREGMRNRFLRQALKALRQADAYIVGTQWLKYELATWLGTDKNIFVVPFGVDRAFYGESAVARERGRRDWRIPEDACVVLHVGSTVDRKNVALGVQEVAGGAAVVVEGRDPGDYVQAIERLDDPDERDELIQRGWVRAREFTWQQTALLTAQVYKPLF